MKIPDIVKYALIALVIVSITGAPVFGAIMVMHSLYKHKPPFVAIGWGAFTIAASILYYVSWHT